MERLQKYLAQAGLGSRRRIEDWITSARITVDGKPAQLGMRVSGNERIALDGKILRLAPVRRRVLMYHKPVGEVCTRSDPEARPTVFERLPKPGSGRWISIGRLDLNTQGLLLLTTDGELANRLMHPSSQIEREYAVRVRGEVDAQLLARLRNGVELDDGPAAFDDIIDAGGSSGGVNHWYHVILRAGRNREVRRLWESQGVLVSRLTRVRFGPIGLPRDLRAERWRDLEAEQIALLLQAAGLQPEDPKLVTRPAAKPSPTRRAQHRRAPIRHR